MRDIELDLEAVTMIGIERILKGIHCHWRLSVKQGMMMYH